MPTDVSVVIELAQNIAKMRDQTHKNLTKTLLVTAGDN